VRPRLLKSRPFTFAASTESLPLGYFPFPPYLTLLHSHSPQPSSPAPFFLCIVAIKMPLVGVCPNSKKCLCNGQPLRKNMLLMSATNAIFILLIL
jgi:hypothetical protein